MKNLAKIEKRNITQKNWQNFLSVFYIGKLKKPKGPKIASVFFYVASQTKNEKKIKKTDVILDCFIKI